jgi:hypothetical protein
MQITMTVPFRRIKRQFSQILRTELRTFIDVFQILKLRFSTLSGTFHVIEFFGHWRLCYPSGTPCNLGVKFLIFKLSPPGSQSVPLKKFRSHVTTFLY